LAYILKDASASLDLRAESGEMQCMLYDPTSGVSSPRQRVTAGQIQTFIKPDKADDWVIYVFSK
jgi:hypothetical protein